MRTITKTTSGKLKIALFSTVAAIAIFVCFSEISFEKNNPDNYDEKMWTGASITSYKMFFDNYKRPELRIERWFSSFAQKYNYDPRRMTYEQAQWFDDAIWTFGWKNPNTAKFIMGFFVNTFGKDVNPDGYFHRFTTDEDKNKWPGNYVPLEFVYLARIPNAILTVLSLLLVFFIGWYFFDFWIGFCASLYLTFNPLFIVTNCLARVSGSATFFSLVVLFLSLLFLKKLSANKSSRKSIFIISILIGVAFALAVGAKLNSGLILYVFVLFFVAFLLQFFRTKNQDSQKSVRLKKSRKIRRKEAGPDYKILKNFLISACLIGAVFYAVFILTNPIFYDKPLLKMKIVKEAVAHFFDIRANALGSNDINKSFLVSLWFVIKRNFVLIDPSLFFGTIGNIFKFKFNFLDLLFVLFGLYQLTTSAITKIKSRENMKKESFIIIWFLVFIVGIADFIWIDWGRYYAPIYYTSSLLFAIGLVGLVKKVKPLIYNLTLKSIF